MPVYEYGGERVDAVQYSKHSDHPYVRQLKPGEFADELGGAAADAARRAEEERAGCAVLEQPGEDPRLVRQGDMIVSRPAEHGELACEVVPAADFLKQAKYVGVRSAELSAGMSASPEHQELRKRRIDEDLDRQVEARERLAKEADERRKAQESEKAEPRYTEPQTSGEPGSPQAAVRGRQGEDGTPHDRRASTGDKEPKPQPAGADGNRGAKAGEPDPDAHRAAAAHGKAKR